MLYEVCVLQYLHISLYLFIPVKEFLDIYLSVQDKKRYALESGATFGGPMISREENIYERGSVYIPSGMSMSLLQ